MAVEKPYACGQWSKARMFGFIRSNIRLASRKWPPIQAAKKAARRPYNGSNARQKWEYLCCECEGWYMGKETQVDHIEPAGSLKDWDDIGPFCKRLFCEVDGLRCICKECHQRKTNREMLKV